MGTSGRMSICDATQLCRFYLPGQGARLGLVAGGSVVDLTASRRPEYATLSILLRASVATPIQALLQRVSGSALPAYAYRDLDREPAAGIPHLLPPVDRQEVWAAGVTYAWSREARVREARTKDVYVRVYEAERPELFFKSTAEKVVGPHDWIGLRGDSHWNVPEPELALVLNPALQVVGYTIGNDVSSRDIEGENPLYLPQAKIYRHSCALGPVITLAEPAAWASSHRPPTGVGGLHETEAPATGEDKVTAIEAPASGGGKVTAAPGGAWASSHRPPTGVGGLHETEAPATGGGKVTAIEAPASGGGKVTAAPGGAWASSHRPPTGVGGLHETEAPASGGGKVTAAPGAVALAVRLTVRRAGAAQGNGMIFQGETSTAHMHRSLGELAGYLGRYNDFPDGAVLLTGTGIVPGDDFSLQDGDEVLIEIEGIGTLRNPVRQM